LEGKYHNLVDACTAWERQVEQASGNSARAQEELNEFEEEFTPIENASELLQELIFRK
jgi:hypothetical protein